MHFLGWKTMLTTGWDNNTCNMTCNCFVVIDSHDQFQFIKVQMLHRYRTFHRKTITIIRLVWLQLEPLPCNTYPILLPTSGNMFKLVSVYLASSENCRIFGTDAVHVLISKALSFPPAMTVQHTWSPENITSPCTFLHHFIYISSILHISILYFTSFNTALQIPSPVPL